MSGPVSRRQSKVPRRRSQAIGTDSSSRPAPAPRQNVQHDSAEKSEDPPGSRMTSRPPSTARSRSVSGRTRSSRQRSSSVVSLPRIDRSNSLVSQSGRWDNTDDSDSNKENTVISNGTVHSEQSSMRNENNDTPKGIFMTSLNHSEYDSSDTMRTDDGVRSRPPVNAADLKKRRESRLRRSRLPMKKESDCSTPDTQPVAANNQVIAQGSGRFHRSTEYIRALGNLRRLVETVEKEINDMKTEFHGGSDRASVSGHVKKCTTELVHCQNVLKASGIRMNALNSELDIVGLLNNLRIANEPDSQALEFVTNLWEKVKEAIDRCYNIQARFENVVYRRLRNSCRGADDEVAISREFTGNVNSFMDNMDETIHEMNLLCRSFGNGLKTELFTDASILDKAHCDTFPLLRLVPEITSRLSTLVDMSRSWINADESYIREVSAKIRINKAQAEEKLNMFEESRPKYRRMLRSVKIAELMCQNQRNGLRTIEAELQSLESQLNEVNLKKRHIESEVYQKENMVDFLQISISKTRHNQTLLMKQSRLAKRLAELEIRLSKIGERCDLLTEQLNEKIQKRAQLVESLNGHQNHYVNLKEQLATFSDRLQTLKQEISELQIYITQFQQIQDIKLQPESIEEFYDRPASVKLAPSLKEKISRRRAVRQHVQEVALLPQVRRRRYLSTSTDKMNQ